MNRDLALLDIKDIHSLLSGWGRTAKSCLCVAEIYRFQSIGAIQRWLLVLENQGAAKMFGEPALDLTDMIATDPAWLGRINILAADRLMAVPRLYASFLFVAFVGTV